jgi:hypothetical protein
MVWFLDTARPVDRSCGRNDRLAITLASLQYRLEAVIDKKEWLGGILKGYRQAGEFQAAAWMVS